MSNSPALLVAAWRSEPPTLTGRTITLREPGPRDLGALVDLLSLGDATRFGMDEPVSEVSVHELIERIGRERAGGTSVTYVIELSGARAIVGLVQVRQLDPVFEAAEWECLI